MNKKKILLATIISISAIAITAGLVWGFRIYQRENDPYWQVAKEIYKVQTALQEVDEDWSLESLSSVYPLSYQDGKGNIINYYCCTSTYPNGEPTDFSGLHKTALSQVLDVDSLENPRNCKVNGMDGLWGELGDKTYLCWTISPKYSCVIEYPTGTVVEEDIIRMAESVAAENANVKNN
mgnify:CR=1 FL=1